MVKNRIKILVDGKTFTLVGDATEEHMRIVSSYIDEKILEVRRDAVAVKLDTSLAYVLAALNVGDDYIKEKEKNAELEEKIAALEEAFFALEEENFALEEENFALEQKNAALEGQITPLAEESSEQAAFAPEAETAVPKTETVAPVEEATPQAETSVPEEERPEEEMTALTEQATAVETVAMHEIMQQTLLEGQPMGLKGGQAKVQQTPKRSKKKHKKRK